MDSVQSDIPEDNLLNLFRYLKTKIYSIVGFGVMVTLATALWSLTLPTTYLSQATYAPTEEVNGGGLSGLSGQLGGIASLAGFSLGNNTVDHVTIAIEILQSRSFISAFITEQNILPQVMAVKGWDKATGTLIYDTDMYDVEGQSWTRDATGSRPSKPTMLEAYEQFFKLLVVEQDKRSGMVKVSLEYFSPEIAQQWLTRLMLKLDGEMRDRETATVSKNLAYLRNKVEQIEDIEIKTIFFNLIQEQTKSLMLAEARQDFVFNIVDPPYIPEIRYSPNRTFICLTAGFLSTFFILLYFTLVFQMKSQRASADW